MSPAARASLFASFAVLVVGIGVFLAILTFTNQRAGAPAPSALGGAFQLTDQDGRRVDQSILNGRTNLMFFGFTHCPDVCPTKLFEMAQVMQRLTPAQRERVQVLFVSVDPERDTPELMKTYLSSFEGPFRGLTGTPDEIAQMARIWRAYYRRVPLEGGAYTMDHSAAVYLIDGQGRFVSTFDTTDPERAAQTLRQRL
jgi:protein SCO1/2